MTDSFEPNRDRDPDAMLGDVVTLTSDLAADMDGLTEGALDELGLRLELVLHAAADLRVLRNALEVALIDAMPEDTMAMNGVVVQRVRKNTWKWKEKDSGSRMRSAIANAIADDMSLDVETGEVNVGRRRLIQQAIDRVWRTIPAVQAMKVAGAKDLDLSIFDYKEMSTSYQIEVSVPEDIATTGEPS